MRLRVAFLTGLVALFFAQAAAAAPAVKLRPVGTVQDGSALFGDGDRFAAWQYGTSVTILDDHGGRRKLTLDQACAPAEPSVRAAGAGKLLVAACPGHGPSGSGLTVVDMRSGAAVAVATPAYPSNELYGGGFYPTFTAVGSRWIRATIGSNHWDGVAFHNWHTGGVTTETFSDDPGRSNVPDLDAPGLYRPLCSPIERTANPNAEFSTQTQQRYLDMQYRRPHALLPVVNDRSTSAALWRCGQKRPVKLASCWDSCRPQLTDTHVVWADNGRIRIRVLASRRTYTARNPDAAAPGAVVATGTRALVATDGTVYAARLPRR